MATISSIEVKNGMYLVHGLNRNSYLVHENEDRNKKYGRIWVGFVHLPERFISKRLRIWAEIEK